MEDTQVIDTLKQQLEASEDWQLILQTILESTDCVTGTLHAFHTDDQLLHLLAAKGVPEELMEKISRIPIGKGIAGAAAERGEAVELCNLQTDTSGTARPDAKKTQVSGSLAIPILEGDSLKGTVGIGMYTPHEFTEGEKQRLWAIAAVLAQHL